MDCMNRLQTSSSEMGLRSGGQKNTKNAQTDYKLRTNELGPTETSNPTSSEEGTRIEANLAPEMPP